MISSLLGLIALLNSNRALPQGGVLTQWGPNLIEDSLFARPVGSWRYLGMAEWDSTVSKDHQSTGSAALRYHPDSSGRILLYGIDLRRHLFRRHYYTFAFYARSSRPNAMLLLVCGYLDSNRKVLGHYNTTLIPITKAHQWQEVLFLCAPTEEAAYATIFIERFNGPENTGVVWVDNVYFGAGIRQLGRSSPKLVFRGKNVRVDARGRMFLYSNQRWQPFFPISIYSSQPPTKWPQYRQQGFNTYIWAWDAAQFRQAANAGFFVGFNITRFVSSQFRYYGDTATLGKELRQILTDSLRHRLIFYYWDNEDYDEFSAVLTVVKYIRRLEHQLVGGPWCPVYALQGNPGIARMFNGITHLSGTYFMQYYGNIHDSTAYDDRLLITQDNRWWTLHLLPDQRTIPFLAQLNYYRDYEPLRLAIFHALIGGAGGIGYYKDPHYPTGIAIELLHWWPLFPQLIDTVKRLLPILRDSILTDLSLQSVTASSVDCIVWTARKIANSELVLFFLNRCHDTAIVTFQLSETSDYEGELYDFFSGQYIGRFTDQTFTLGLLPQSVRILRSLPTNTSAEETASSLSTLSLTIQPPYLIATASFPILRWQIVDLQGRLVATYNSGRRFDSPMILWDGRTISGGKAATSLYYLHVTGPTTNQYRLFRWAP